MAIIVNEDNKVVTVENEPEEARAMFPNLQEGGGVKDVKIDGTSIVDANGDAVIPKGGTDVYGVFKLSHTPGLYGIELKEENLNILSISPASSSEIKAGSVQYKPIVPYKQYVSAFYGMAKAAGDATQAASDNAVGTYTDEAKIAIQKMLGIYEAPWELIRGDTFTNETEADYTIDTDSNNSPFELTDVYLEVWIEAPTQQASVGSSGRVDFFYAGDNYFPQYLGTASVEVGGNSKGACVLITASKGAIIRENTSYQTMGTDRNALGTPSRVDTNRSLLIALNPTFYKIKILAVTGKMNYRLYGKRKWQ